MWASTSRALQTLDPRDSTIGTAMAEDNIEYTAFDTSGSLLVTSLTSSGSELREALLEDSDCEPLVPGSGRKRRNKYTVADAFIESSKNTPHYVKEDTSEDVIA